MLYKYVRQHVTYLPTHTHSHIHTHTHTHTKLAYLSPHCDIVKQTMHSVKSMAIHKVRLSSVSSSILYYAMLPAHIYYIISVITMKGWLSTRWSTSGPWQQRMWHRWSVYLVLSSLLVSAACLSFAEGGEGTSVGGHYWLLCSVEESVLAISCASSSCTFSYSKVLYILFQMLPWRNATQLSDRIMYVALAGTCQTCFVEIEWIRVFYMWQLCTGVVTHHWLTTGTIQRYVYFDLQRKEILDCFYVYV